MDLKNMTPFQEKWNSYKNWDDEEIRGFFGPNDYRFLSNFEPCDIYWDGFWFPSVEHAYQIAKIGRLSDLEDKTLIYQFQHFTAVEAKNFGQKISLRSDWERVKAKIMFELVYQKFAFNKGLGEKLLATGDKYLEETNHWKDKFYGVDAFTREGKNMLGKILMAVRNNLKLFDL
jgi:ribA/ribD-fused uncharacterized protein